MSEQHGVENQSPRKEVVNDFVINVATANGTGSQTSNVALARAMFRMGISVAPKNLFPSNIQGLPTWYRMRVNDKGYTGYQAHTDILVAMNQATVADDVPGVSPGGVIFYDTALRMPPEREDVTYYAMPVKDLVKEIEVPSSLRGYIANMVYVGVVCELLGIEFEEIRRALDTHFKGKQKAVELNMKMIDIAAEWTKKNVVKEDPFRVARIEGGNANKILAEGNESGALGSVYGGVTVVAWYPITPATSLADGLNEYLPALRNDKETGKTTYAIFQAEDELSALGSVIGAGWAGARSMTSTSGPGISLMSEFTGLAYFAEIPAVVWDIQRMGPSTGLPTRTSQGDILSTYFLSHGDCRHVLLFPSSPAECFEFGHVALDLAERLQTIVFVLSDLDLGMNLWITDEFEYPEKPLDRGKVLSPADLDRLGHDWGRFEDVDGDGIGYRTIPGTEHRYAGFFTRGTGHNAKAVYSEKSADWEENLQRLQRKFETARKLVPAPAIERREGATFGLISLGSNHPGVVEALDILESQGIVCDYLRIKGLPIHEDVNSFVNAYEKVYVVENNFDGQLHKILQLEMPEKAMELISVARCNGLPIDAKWLSETIQSMSQA